MQYYAGNETGIEPLAFVTPVDDQDFLVDQFAALLAKSVATAKPFLAVLFFHGVVSRTAPCTWVARQPCTAVRLAMHVSRVPVCTAVCMAEQLQ